MSEKNLLKEGTIRRFMKLAGTEAITNNFLTETEGSKKDPNVVTGRWLKEQDEEPEAEAGAEELPAGLPGEPPGGEEGPEDEMEMDLEEPEGEETEEEPPDFDPEDLAQELFQKLADTFEEFGVDVDVSETPTEELEVGDMGEPPEEGEEEMDLGAEMEGPEGEEEGEELEEPEGLEEATAPYKWGKKYGEKACLDANNERVHNSRCEKEQKAQQESLELEEINYIDEDALMQETYRRVVNRLTQEQRADKMATVLAEKISRRLRRR